MRLHSGCRNDEEEKPCGALVNDGFTFENSSNVSMLENIRRYVLMNPVQVGAALIVAILTALLIIGGRDPWEMLIRIMFFPLF